MDLKSSVLEDPNEELILEEEISEEEDVGEKAHLVVYNDDFNTFDWVIECFVEILRHSYKQAEQLSLIIHFKGKATVKSGPKSTLMPKKDALLDRGLSAVIEED